jgi:uncharacterized lipoprotein YddW (UPF0748 family)
MTPREKFAIAGTVIFVLSFIPLPGSAESAPPAPKGLFVSVLQEPPVLSDRQAIEELVENARRDGYKVLFVQVYRANEAWFPSEYARNTSYEQSVKKVGEDPLALLIRRAHASGLEVHAWLNLLSLSADGKAPILQKYGPSILTRNISAKKTLDDYRVDRQYFLEPGDTRVSRTHSKIVAELVGADPELDSSITYATRMCTRPMATPGKISSVSAKPRERRIPTNRTPTGANGSATG